MTKKLLITCDIKTFNVSPLLRVNSPRKKRKYTESPNHKIDENQPLHILGIPLAPIGKMLPKSQFGMDSEKSISNPIIVKNHKISATLPTALKFLVQK